METLSISRFPCVSVPIIQLDNGSPICFAWRRKRKRSMCCHCSRSLKPSDGFQKSGAILASVHSGKNSSVSMGESLRFFQRPHRLKFDFSSAGEPAVWYASVGICFALVCSADQEEKLGEEEGENGKFRIKCDDDQQKKLLERIAIQAERGKEERNEVICSLATGLRSATNAQHVQEFIKGNEFPLPVYSSVIRALGKEHYLEAAMALFHWLKTKRKGDERRGEDGGDIDRRGEDGGDIDFPNVYIYNSLLGALKASGRYKMVDRVMEEMVVEGISPNVVTFNTLMCTYQEQGRFCEALDLLPELRRQGLTPTPVTYSTVLLTFRKMGDAKGALNFFLDLKERYKKGELDKDLDEQWIQEFPRMENFVIRICFQTMRKWLVKGGDIKDVLTVLRIINDSGPVMGLREYERLVWSCSSGDHYLVARELYEQMQKKEMKISVSICNHVIWVLGRGKKWWAALEIYENMLERGPAPNNRSRELIVSHFNVLLNAARRRGIWKWAISLLSKMQEKGLKPGITGWNSALVACSKASQTAAAVEVFQQMVGHGEKPNILSYGALLSALEKGKLYEQVLQVWEHMQRMGVQSNIVAYTIMVSVHSTLGRFEDVHTIIHQMLASGIQPTVVTYNAVISACANTGMGVVALEWLELMRAENISPNAISYEKSIEALAKEGKWELAYDVYLKAQKQKVSPSAKAYDAVLGVCQAHNASIDLGRLGLRPCERTRGNNNVQIQRAPAESDNIPGNGENTDISSK